MSNRRGRGQAALEFLLTNGWAIFTVIILLAVLFYIGVLSPQRSQPNTCAFPPGLSCYSFKVGNGSGSLELDFGQALGKSVQVNGISCSMNESANFTPITPIYIPSGEHRWIAGGDSGNMNVTCENATGELGERYSGRLCVSYEELDTRTSRIACCDMRAQLEPGITPTPTPTPTPMPVTGCPFYIDAPGNYALNTSFSSSGTDCIIVDSRGRGSTIDCQGNQITGPGIHTGTSGVYLFNTAGVTVRNCIISNFTYGVRLDNAGLSTISGNTIFGNSNGMMFGGGIGPAQNNSVTGNQITGNEEGIELVYLANWNTFSGNTISANTGDAISLRMECNSNVISGNTIEGNDGAGVSLRDDSNYNGISGNSIKANQRGGILLDNANWNNITGNRVISNYMSGVLVSSAHDNNFTGNTVMESNRYGYLDFSCPTPDTNHDGGGNMCADKDACDWLTCGSRPPCTNPITECCNVTAPGEYTLSQDISTDFTCIGIQGSANGTTLDCEGHRLVGADSGKGIIASNVRDVWIRNCSITNFSFGILASGTGLNVTGNSVSYANSTGIQVSCGSEMMPGNIVEGNIAGPGDGTGILVMCTGADVAGNLAENNSDGFYVEGENNSIRGNTANSNSHTGFQLSSLRYSNITGNAADSNFQYGFYLSSGEGYNFSANTVTNTVQTGIVVQGAIRSSIEGNAVTDSFNGVVFGNSYSNNVTGNTVVGSSQYDFICDPYPNNDLGGNICDTKQGCAWIWSCGPPTPITSCQQITIPGRYALAANLTATSGNVAACGGWGPPVPACIRVCGTSDVSLDCAGNSITASPSLMAALIIWAPGPVAVYGGRIANCNLQGGAIGIYGPNVNGLNISGNNVSGASYDGITVGGSGGTISGNRANGNTNSGFNFYNAANFNVSGNTAMDNGASDFLCTSSPSNSDRGGNICNNMDACGPNPPNWLSCSLPSPGWLFGVVRNSTGDPVENANVATRDELGVTTSNTTNATGQYVIYGLRSGAHTVNASHDGYADNLTAASIGIGAGTELQLTLYHPGWFYGAITNSTGGAVEGATLTAQKGAYSWSNTTNSSGEYVIYGLAPGTYSVNASKSGLQANSTSAAVGEGAGTEVSLTLYPAPSIQIHNCQYIDLPGDYVLADDFTSGSSVLCHSGTGMGACLCVRASNVNINCGGKTVTAGPGQNGAIGYVLVGTPRTGGSITNCRVQGSFVGIWLDSMSGTAISGCNSTSNTYGMALLSSSNLAVTGNTVTGNSNDFLCNGVSSSTASGNTCGHSDGCSSWITTCPP